MKCVVCGRSDRAAIDEMILAGSGPAEIGRRFDLVPIDVLRHHHPYQGDSHVSKISTHAGIPTPARTPVGRPSKIAAPSRVRELTPQQVATAQREQLLLQRTYVMLDRERLTSPGLAMSQGRQRYLLEGLDTLAARQVLSDIDQIDPERHWIDHGHSVGRRRELLSQSPAGAALLREEDRRRRVQNRSGRV